MMRLDSILCNLLLVFFILLSASLFPQAHNTPIYSGDISTSDLRVADLKRSIAKQEVNRQAMKFRYSRKHLDYVVFYDLDGHEIYFKYREDRFDLRAEKKIQGLIPGHAYQLKGDFMGIYLGQIYYTKDDSQFKENIGNSDTIPVFDFQEARGLRVDQILL